MTGCNIDTDSNIEFRAGTRALELDMTQYSVPLYDCPVHGEVGDVVHSIIPGHEGYWCMRCWLEMLDKAGVSRVVAK